MLSTIPTHTSYHISFGLLHNSVGISVIIHYVGIVNLRYLPLVKMQQEWLLVKMQQEWLHNIMGPSTKSKYGAYSKRIENF